MVPAYTHTCGQLPTASKLTVLQDTHTLLLIYSLPWQRQDHLSALLLLACSFCAFMFASYYMHCACHHVISQCYAILDLGAADLSNAVNHWPFESKPVV